MVGTSTQVHHLSGLLVAWLLAGIGCSSPIPPVSERATASVALPLVGGQPDSEHPAVGWILSDKGACSGTLISKQMVLTAGHCIPAEFQSMQFYVFAADGTPLPAVDVVETFVHPEYDPEGFYPQELGLPHDVALLLLAEAPVVEPVDLGFLPLECLEGSPVTFVGFGLSNPADPASGGKKLFLETEVGKVVESGFWTFSIPGAPKNACPGDSGGAALMEQGGQTYLVGVMSLADKYCEAETFCARTDQQLSWLLPILAEKDPGGLPTICGDKLCELAEEAALCPADCPAGTGTIGSPCATEADCSAPLFCALAGDSGTCTRWCASPATGTGCSCGQTCGAFGDGSDPDLGVCVAHAYPGSQCGNDSCQGGESFLNCPHDCQMESCGDFPEAGCCLSTTVAWCEGGILRMQSCQGNEECGWDIDLGRYACGTDGFPAPGGQPPLVCPALPAECGNGVCEPGEEQASCPVDCLYPGFCGDGTCNGTEDFTRCPEDCKKETCDVLPEAGCCEGEVAVWCFEGDLFMASCQHHPSCGWDEQIGLYGCGSTLGPDPAGVWPLECSAYQSTECGDGNCEEGEDHVNCPDDCEPLPEGCGDGSCGPGEDYTICPQDCTLEGCGKIGEQGCCDGEIVNWCIGDKLFLVNCVEEPLCGWSAADGYYWCGTDGSAEPELKHLKDCSAVAAAFCGDGGCQAGENKLNCPEDCTPKPTVECGDALCDATENPASCPQDCAPPDEGGQADLAAAPELRPEIVAAEETPPEESSGSGGGSCQVGHRDRGHGALALLLALLLGARAVRRLNMVALTGNHPAGLRQPPAGMLDVPKSTPALPASTASLSGRRLPAQSTMFDCGSTRACLGALVLLAAPLASAETIEIDVVIPSEAGEALPPTPWNHLLLVDAPGLPTAEAYPVLVLLPPDLEGRPSVELRRGDCLLQSEAPSRTQEIAVVSMADGLPLPSLPLPGWHGAGTGSQMVMDFLAGAPAKEGDVVLLPLLLFPGKRSLREGTYELCRRLTLTVSFARSGAPAPADGHANLRRLSRQVLNPDQLDSWYLEVARDSEAYDYLVVTRQSYAETSEALGEFIAFKQGQGFNPLLVTLEEIIEDMGGQNAAVPDVLRDWLRKNYKGLGFKYVLLLGDPAPEAENAVPMKRCFPAVDFEAPDSQLDVPTDMYFADLSGDWNPDGDDLWCELEDYMELPEDWPPEPGGERLDGVDLVPELLVARIPHYGKLPHYGDGILKRLMAYEATAPADWHNRVLLPAPMVTFPDGDYVDASQIAKYFIGKSLAEAGVGHTTLVECEGNLFPAYEGDGCINENTVSEQWNKGFGAVFWCAHGNQEGACHDIWNVDFNGNGLPEQSETEEPAFINVLFYKIASDEFPPVVFEGSCLNADPDYPGNLAHTLLQHVSMGNVASTRITMGLAPGDEWQPSPYTPGAFTLGLYFTHAAVVLRRSVAQSFAYAQEMVSFGVQPWTFKAKLEFNLYGDPSMVIPGCDSDADCNDEDVCTGTETCVNGRCEGGEHLSCKPEAPLAECQESVCLPDAGCMVVEKPAHASCEDGNPCTDLDSCVEGICQGIAIWCPPDQESCRLGACDPEVGQCGYDEVAPDGRACRLGGRDGSCKQGTCVLFRLPENEADLSSQAPEPEAASADSDPDRGGGGCETTDRGTGWGAALLLLALFLQRAIPRVARPV